MRYTIGEMAEIIDGDRGKNYPQQHEFLDEGYCLFLNTGNVTKAGFSFDSNQFISKEKCDLLRKGKLQRHDIVYTTRGTVGNAAYYSDSIPYEHVRINSGMVIIRPKEAIVCTEFLYQILKSDYYRPFFRKHCTGSAQPQLPIKNFSTIELDLPDLPVQCRIAGILSTYDDLIENNQKQIKLLEEAAQRLYKEWFVDLRFPGHENVKIVDGVPEGWENASVTDLLEIRYGKDHKGLADGCIPVYGSGGIMRKVDKILYSGESVLIPRKGSLNNILLVSGDFWTIDTMFYSVPKRPNVAKYVYLYLTGIDMYAMNIGAAVPSMSVKILDGMRLLCPSDSILELFETTAKPYYEMIELLKKKQSMLGETRDRLLPKLMSGEIEV